MSLIPNLCQSLTAAQRTIPLILLSLLCACTSPGQVSIPKNATAELDTNWTLTYLKAVQNQRAPLRQFIEQNWFAMDAVAVERGVFKSYQLMENMQAYDFDFDFDYDKDKDKDKDKDNSNPNEPEWDFIVAVEYFGDQTYADVRDEFEAIRSAHETVLIDGKDFRDLGQVVRSERVRVHDY